MHKNSFLCVAAALFLVACASVSDIDTSKANPDCVQPCAQTYSACVSKFTFFPLMVQHQCTDAYRLCIQACPSLTGQQDSHNSTIERLQQLKDLRDAGILTQKEYEQKRKAVVDGLRF